MSKSHDLSSDTLALVLAGGSGTRLGELTRHECKPAIPFAGQFRNIDFTLSNCVNSHIRRIAVLTQYKAQTLINHITCGWNFLSRPLGEFVEVWPAQQRLHSAWYAGTADAVYQNLDLILAQHVKYILVLGGDHIYKMDYRRLLEQHVESGADVTVACLPVPVEEAGGFGVLGCGPGGRVQRFIEKPPPSSFAPNQKTVLASMGIYVFATDYLVDRLQCDARKETSSHDFGHDILPAAVREDYVCAHEFTDDQGQPAYWRDVGTVEAYWQAHMELLGDPPPLDLYDSNWPILSRPQHLPPAKLLYDAERSGFVSNSLLSGGTVVDGATVTNSVLSPNVYVGRGSVLDEAVVLSGVRIGPNCILRRVIIDTDTVVPAGTVITPPERDESMRARIRLVADNSESRLRSVA